MCTGWPAWCINAISCSFLHGANCRQKSSFGFGVKKNHYLVCKFVCLFWVSGCISNKKFFTTSRIRDDLSRQLARKGCNVSLPILRKHGVKRKKKAVQYLFQIHTHHCTPSQQIFCKPDPQYPFISLAVVFN